MTAAPPDAETGRVLDVDPKRNLWRLGLFRLMNPRVAEVYGGDLSKAYLSARSKRRLGLT